MSNKQEIFIFKVNLTDYQAHVRNMPYKIIAIKSDTSLYDFAFTIIKSFNFDFDHAFGFYSSLKHMYDSNEAYELFVDIDPNHTKEQLRSGAIPQSVKRTLLSSVFTEIKKKMLFFFDYGDEWRFLVQLQKIESPTSKARYPKVIESCGPEIVQYPEYDEYEEEIL